MSVCIYVCVFVYMYVFVSIYIYEIMHIFICTHLYTGMCVCMSVYIYVYYIYMYIYIYYLYIYIYTYTQTYGIPRPSSSSPSSRLREAACRPGGSTAPRSSGSLRSGGISCCSETETDACVCTYIDMHRRTYLYTYMCHKIYMYITCTFVHIIYTEI